ncbi:MAG: hypothetical protein J6B92_05370 [Paraprevotella sp.]|nr:hypothetical protein [Paraprevotella sp.]
MKQEFITAVAEKNLAKVRISLTNELLLDPRGTTFSEMLTHAINNIPNLFDENKEANYTVPPQAKWDEDFLFKVKNDLDSNFSREKLAFYETVVKIVGKSKAEGIEQEENKVKGQKATKSQQNQEHPINKTYATISAGGATLALIGLVAGKTLLTVVGGAVLIVGGVLLLNDKMENK